MNPDQKNFLGINMPVFKTIHYIVLLAMLHSTFIAPAQCIFTAYFDEGQNFKENSYSQPDKLEKPREDFSSFTNTEPDKSKKIPENPKKLKLEFASDIEEGTIGMSKEKPIDNPSDNLFKIFIEKLPSENYKAYLTYDLYGVGSHNGVSRSINERLSVGGYLVKKNYAWSRQKEEIDASWLRKGINTVLFTIPEGADYNYKIKNLTLKIEKSENILPLLSLSKQDINLTKEGKVYIKGFIRGNHPTAKIEAGGTVLKVFNNEFEGYIQLNDAARNSKILVIRAIENGVLLGQEIFMLDNLAEADRDFKIEKKPNTAARLFVKGEAAELVIDGASLTVTDTTITKDYELSVTQLRAIDIAPMESGMINVTKGKKAYRFLPEGTKFDNPVTINIEYDTLLLPQGYTPKDIKTYYFDIRSKRWVAVQKDSVDLNRRLIISKTNHFTDYINGIIQVPESPETSAFTPTMMNDIKAADPSSEITLVSPPQVSQRGDANIGYPIKIPAGRNGMQPNVGLQYSNNGNNGWLGQGWSLSVPAITIETRWGTPKFDAQKESELYLLSGEQLMYQNGYMPNRHQESGGGTITTVMPNRTSGSTVFYPRKQGSFAKIERLGSSPSTYYWKVTSTDGTISWYGGKTAPVANAVLRGANNNIVHWALYMVEDVYGNNIKYTYHNTTIPTQSGANANLNSGKIFYLQNIYYTGYNGGNGNYQIEFVKESTVRPDPTINTRMGFKWVDPYRLATINVRYGTGGTKPVFRSYNLQYITGRFNKSLLSKIIEKGEGGVFAYSHTFEYYDDILQGENEVYFSAGIDINICNDEYVPCSDMDADGVCDENDPCPDQQGPPGSNGCPEVAQGQDCYYVTFPVPMTNVTYSHVYTSPVHHIYTNYLSGNYCLFEPVRIAQFTFDGNSFNSPGNLYLTHYLTGVGVTDLCEDNATYSTAIRYPDFETNAQQWFANQVMYVPGVSNVNVLNKSELGIEGVAGTIHTKNYFEISFLSPNLHTANCIMQYGPNGQNFQQINDDGYFTTQIYSGSGYPVDVKVNDLSLNNPQYNLYDNVNDFITDFQQQYGSQAEIILSLTEMTIKVPNSSVPLNSIYVNGNTYYFESCREESTAGRFANSFNTKSLFAGGINNYEFSFDATIPFGNPDCPSFFNENFLFQGNVPSFDNTASILGSSGSEGISGGGYLGVGIGTNPMTKMTTFGVQANWGNDESKGITSQIDINGDGLDDIVIKQGNNLYYKKHTIERTYNEEGLPLVTHSYGPKLPITGMNNFYRSYGRSRSFNFQITLGVASFGGFAGVDSSESDSETDIFFTDGNGDGLPDIVKDGKVYFNKLDANGNPTYIDDSKYTENMVITAEPRTIELPDTEAEIDLPQYDVVKVWEAPSDGNIKITNNIVLTDLSKESIVTIEKKDLNNVCYHIDIPCDSNLRHVTLNGDTYLGQFDLCSQTFKTAFETQFPGTIVYLNSSSIHILVTSSAPGVFNTITTSINPPGDFETGFVIAEIMVEVPVVYNFFIGPCTYSQLRQPVNEQKDKLNTLSDLKGDYFNRKGFTFKNEIVNCQVPYPLCVLFGENLNSTTNTINNVITTDCDGGTLTVNKGDRIYFRVHSIDAENPVIDWDPLVEYTNSSLLSMVDPNGVTPYKSKYSDGFVLSSTTGEIFPGTSGTAHITWPSFQVKHTDEVKYQIYKRLHQYNGTSEPTITLVTSPVYTFTCAANVLTTVPSGNLSVTVTEVAGQQVEFYYVVSSSSNSKWKQGEWKPKMECTTTESVIGDGSVNEGDLTVTQTIYPIPDYSIYRQYPCGPSYSLLNVSGFNGGTGLTVTPNLNSVFSANDNGIIYFVVKRGTTFIGRRKFTVNNGSVSVDNASGISLGSSGLGSNVELTFTTDDSNGNLQENSLLSKIASSSNTLAIISWSISSANVPSNKINLQHKVGLKFGHMYRQWGQFLYNPSVVTNAIASAYGNLIKEEVLTLNESDISDLQDAIDDINGFNLNQSQEQIETMLNNFQANNQDLLEYTAMLPPKAKRAEIQGGYQERWVGFSTENYASAFSFRAAGLTESLQYAGDYYLEQDILQTGAYAISKFSDGNSKNVSGGVNAFGAVNVSGSKSWDAANNVTTDYIDFNGDRYPDILGPGKLQYTNQTGGLKPIVTRNGHISVSESENIGISASGSFSQAQIGLPPKPQKSFFSRFNPFRGNTGAGISGSLSSGESETKTMWTDINGDGLVDYLVRNESNNTLSVSLNYGSSTPVSLGSWSDLQLFETNSDSKSAGIGLNLWNGSAEAGVSLASSMNSTEDTMVDMNGDGLMDFVASGNDLHVKINTGNKFLIIPDAWADYSLGNESKTTNAAANFGYTYSYLYPIPIIPPIFLKIPSVNVNGTLLSTGTSRTKKSITDFDGDGYPDLLEETGPNTLKIRSSNIRRTNMLKTVSNPLGGSFTVDYKVITPTYDDPNPHWVMTNVVIEDGYDFQNDGFDVYKKTYEYENARYDRREREFYGFETVKTIDYTMDEDGEQEDIYRISVSKYHNRSYFLNGLLKEAYVMQGDDETKLFSKSVNTYVLKALESDGVIDVDSELDMNFDVGGREGRKGAAVLLAKTQSYVYELGQNPLVYEINFEYDEYARVIQYIDKGTPDPADDYKSIINYQDDPALITKNIINIPFMIEVRQVSTNQLFRKRLTEVDVNTGDITKITTLLNNQQNAETQMGYDQYGNLKNIILPEDDNSQTMTYIYTYDGIDNKYIEEITDSYGYSSYNYYDHRYDQIIQSIDITGNSMSYEYDKFGRIITIKAPKENQNNVPYTITFNYYPVYTDLPSGQNCVDSQSFIPIAITKHYDEQHSGNDIETITLIDGLARPAQVKKDIEINAGSQQTPDYTEAMSFSGMTEYDEFGRPVKQYHPGQEDKNCQYNYVLNEQSTLYYAETIYDEADRAVQAIDPEGNNSFVEYSISQDFYGNPTHKTRSVVDQNGQANIISESFKDVRGRLTSSKNILSGTSNQELWTSFAYNVIGELLSYTDAENLSTTYKYDYAGRKTEVNHPDRGKVTYVYDKSGKLTKLQTANLAANTNLQPDDRYIKYGYYFNRPTKISYPPTPSGPNLANVDYEYGNSGNETGRLIYQRDATGEQYFEYGNMGEMTKNTRVVVGPNIPTRTFETLFSYDSWNRLKEMTYPDGEKVAYTYNRGGNLFSIEGEISGQSYHYVKRIDYDHFEERTYLLYGNNTETVYMYTPALRRLDRLLAFTSTQEVMINNRYNYDKVGNITSVDNSAAPNSINYMGGSYRHTYIYDNLNRLTSASGQFDGDSNMSNYGNDYQSTYSTSMEYNATHGIAGKRQNHTKNGQQVNTNSYDNVYNYISGSHQVKDILDSNTSYAIGFGYDLNGNMVYTSESNGDTRNMYWDESDRLRVVDINSQDMQHYIYDASGERILKAGSNIEQVYENGTLTSSSVTFNSYTTYPSAYIVVKGDGEYSKHYYLGSQRIVSRIGENNADIFENGQTSPRMPLSSQEGEGFSEDKLRQSQINDLTLILQKAKKGIPLFKDYTHKEDDTDGDNYDNADSPGFTLKAGPPSQFPDKFIYFYHANHLGTSTYLTDANGMPYQFYINLPFGETMAEQHSLTENYESPYKFNGKELDEETGWYYYGARYYNPKTSIWLSVDPLAEKYPNFNPYVYCYQNPVRFIDPTGMQGEDHIFNIKGELIEDTGKGSNIYIEIDGKRLKPSQLDPSKKEHRQALANVGGYYRRKMQIPGKAAAGADTKQEDSVSYRNPAYTIGELMILNGNGCFSESLDDYYNLQNIIFHEGKHVIYNMKGLDQTLETHAGIYFDQIEHDSFKNATQEYRGAIVNSFALYLLNMDRDETQNYSYSIINLIEGFNELKTGYKISHPFQFQAGELYLNVTNPNGTTNEIIYEKVDR